MGERPTMREMRRKQAGAERLEELAQIESGTSYVALCEEGHVVACAVKGSQAAQEEVGSWTKRGYEVATKPTEWVREEAKMCDCPHIVGD